MCSEIKASHTHCPRCGRYIEQCACKPTWDSDGNSKYDSSDYIEDAKFGESVYPWNK